MSKFWRVFSHEYARHVLRKRFIFALVSMPLFISVIMAISIFSAVTQTNFSPIGYIDHSGFLANPIYPPETQGMLERTVKLIAYPDEASARQALEANKIQAYYVLATDYLETARADLVFVKEPDNEVQNQFITFLTTNILTNQPAAVRDRIASGNSITIQSLDGSQRMSESDWFNILVPILSGVLFFIVILTSGGYLLQAVVEEKENRTIEIVVTSVSPGQLMAGKIAGNISVGLTQLLVWILFLLVGILIGRNTIDWVQRIQIQPSYLVLMALTLLPTFVMIAALMAAIGSMVTEMREAQQISGLFTLPVMIPYWFTAAIMTNPNGPLAIGLSYFPLTAPVTLVLRAGFTQIPTGQLVINLLVLAAAAVVSVWLAARTFHMGMLNYGKRLSWRQVFGKSTPTL
ncbi:MAG: ABC transporter permease [Chloroflexi bacterium]|nr:ABC transporter permease [Chloroflexota bacterium]